MKDATGDGGLPHGTPPVPRTEVKVGPPKWNPTARKANRSGVVTGARVVLLFQRGALKVASAAQVADRLGMERGYIRRILNQLADAHILTQRFACQPGTPDVSVFRLRNPPRRPHRAREAD